MAPLSDLDARDREAIRRLMTLAAMNSDRPHVVAKITALIVGIGRQAARAS